AGQSDSLPPPNSSTNLIANSFAAPNLLFPVQAFPATALAATSPMTLPFSSSTASASLHLCIRLPMACSSAALSFRPADTIFWSLPRSAKSLSSAIPWKISLRLPRDSSKLAPPSRSIIPKTQALSGSNSSRISRKCSAWATPRGNWSNPAAVLSIAPWPKSPNSWVVTRDESGATGARGSFAALRVVRRNRDTPRLALRARPVPLQAAANSRHQCRQPLSRRHWQDPHGHLARRTLPRPRQTRRHSFAWLQRQQWLERCKPAHRHPSGEPR